MAKGGYAWREACMAGGVNDEGGAWQGNMHGRGGDCTKENACWRMSLQERRPLKSYWNAFLCHYYVTLVVQIYIDDTFIFLNSTNGQFPKQKGQIK